MCELLFSLSNIERSNEVFMCDFQLYNNLFESKYLIVRSFNIRKYFGLKICRNVKIIQYIFTL